MVWRCDKLTIMTKSNTRTDAVADAIRSIVSLKAEVPPDAFTAGILGTERDGHALIIDQSGLLLTVGYLILALRGCCASGFSVIIPIIGWLALIKGILIFVRPEMMMNMTKAMLKEKTIKLMMISHVFCLQTVE